MERRRNLSLNQWCSPSEYSNRKGSNTDGLLIRMLVRGELAFGQGRELFLFLVHSWFFFTLQRIVCVAYAFDTLESTAFPHQRGINIQLGIMLFPSLD